MAQQEQVKIRDLFTLEETIAKEYLLDYVGLVDSIFAGKPQIDEGLNHKYIENAPDSAKVCRVRFGGASIFAYREEVEEIAAAAKE